MAEPTTPAPGGTEPLVPCASGAETSTVVGGTANVHPIPLETVRIDERLQARVEGNDPKHVKELVEHSNPGGWLPIRVAQINGEHWLIGGFHRVAAAKELGLSHLPAVVVPASNFDEALLMAFEDNKHHGKPPTLEDRKEHARLLAKLRTDLSWREIGRRAGINHETAKAAVEGKPQVEVGENRHEPASPGATNPLPSLIERLEDLFNKGECDASDIERAAREHIERWEGDDRRITAENLAHCGSGLLAAARSYGAA